MLIRFVLAFSLVALVAFAGSIPAKVATYHVTLTESVSINGTALKAGAYKVAVNEGKVLFILDKESREVPAKVETGTRKYSDTQVQYEQNGGQTTIKEICLGGTKTRLVFN